MEDHLQTMKTVMVLLEEANVAPEVSLVQVPEVEVGAMVEMEMVLEVVEVVHRSISLMILHAQFPQYSHNFTKALLQPQPHSKVAMDHLPQVSSP